MPDSHAATTHTKPAGLLRRLFAILYDLLLILALWMVIGAVFVAANKGVAVEDRSLQLTLLVVAILYFWFFWRQAGQTTGMQAWRLKLITPTGGRISTAQVILRLVGATVSAGCVGLGYIWMLIDKESLTWHDRLSDTRLIVMPKDQKNKLIK